MPETTQAKLKAAGRLLAKNVPWGEGRLRFSMAQALIALVLMFVTSPFVEQMKDGRLIEAALMTLVLVSAVLGVVGRRKMLIWAIILVIPTLAARWLNHLYPEKVPPEIYLGGGLLFLVFVLNHYFRFILRAPKVTAEVLCAAVATYLLLALFWALAYTLAAQVVPNSFTFTAGPAAARGMEGFNCLYFSLGTLATLAYGDIIPVSGVARMLAVMEVAAGVFFVALLIARLVSLYSVANADEGQS